MTERMAAAVYDNLFQLVMHGPRESGEIPSKGWMEELIEQGWVTHTPNVDKCWNVTSKGIEAFLAEYEQIPDPAFPLFGAIYIQFAERCGDNELDGKPLVVLGGAMAWVTEHMLGQNLTFSKYFGSYDYATFDYVHRPDEKEYLLKPGDWLILREDHNHTIHRFDADEDEE